MIPEYLTNLIGSVECPPHKRDYIEKISPHSGQRMFLVPKSGTQDVQGAVEAAMEVKEIWAQTPAVQRGMILLRLVRLMQDRADEIAGIVALETGKSVKDAKGEVSAAVQCGLFYASEGQRLYGRTTTSGVINKYAMTIRQPIGVAGLIIAANTPIANVAWKVFPALICGNSAVLKASEDAPATAWYFGRLAAEAGIPSGVLNIVHGLGAEAGDALVRHPDVGVISFTGSTRVGRLIQQIAGQRFARVSLELGGKNPLVVCDDADLEHAAKWTLLSAFSNAGQRCAAAGRIIVFDSVYDRFRDLLAEKIRLLRVGPNDSDDYGPVINRRQMENMLRYVQEAEAAGAVVLIGGHRMTDVELAKGWYVAPTLLENVAPDAPLSCTELFGPIAALYRVKDFEDALRLSNSSPYGLTACIHTRSFSRAIRFCDRVQTGVAIVNAGTFGSEPHMPFGGRKESGNGSREPGTEALNVYSELKDLYLNVDLAAL
jgi:aldehyde dehydrogenase (NAD+)